MRHSVRDERLRLMLVPLMMLPLMVVALWMAFAPATAQPPLRWTVALTAAAIVWYLLGGALALHVLLERLRAGRMLRRLAPALASLDDPVWASDAAGRVLWQNAAAQGVAAAQAETIAGAFARRSADPEALIAGLKRRAGPGGAASAPIGDAMLELQHRQGASLCIWRLHRKPVAPAGTMTERIPGCAAVGDALEVLAVPLLRISQGGRITAANAAAVALLGPIPADATMATIFDGLGRPVEEWVDDVLHARTEPRPEVVHRRGEGPDLFVQVTLSLDRTGGLLAVISDASALKTLEAQFVQSQKMQAIGQLAGGIAHDFNNLLTAISGHVDLLMLRHDKADPDYADLDQIRQNGNRAAALVSQLLAFSRKQTLKPRLIDLRDTLADLMHLMNRLVGERIVLSFEHDPALNPIRADQRQFEQVIINLVVNARDAMPGGGRITITTANVNQTGAGAGGGGTPMPGERIALPKGRYVRITVADEGCGIPQDQMSKIFEPFFTTKRTGEGTGLGLATVYGIVK